MKRTGPLSRPIFDRRNSTVGSRVPVENLYPLTWWMDTGELFGEGQIYIHAESVLDDTVHRVHPRRIKGRVCRRIAMRRGVPCWLYDRVDAHQTV